MMSLLGSIIAVRKKAGFQVEDREDIQAFELSRDSINFENDLIKTGIIQANDLEKIDVSFRNALYAAAQQNEWNLDRDALNNAAALSRLNLSNSHALNLMGLQQSHDFNMANLTFAQADKVAELGFERTKELAALGEDSQIRIMDYVQNKDRDQIMWQIGFETKVAQALEFRDFETKQDVIDEAYTNPNWRVYMARFINTIFPTTFTPKGYRENIEGVTAKQIEDALNSKGQDADAFFDALLNPTSQNTNKAWELFKKNNE